MQHYLRWVCAGQAAQGVGTWFVLCWKCTFGRQLQGARPLTPPHCHFAALPLRYKYGNVTGSTANAATGALTLTVPTEMTGGCNESVGCYTASCGVSSCVHLQHPFAHPKRRLLTLARCDAGFAIQPPAGPAEYYAYDMRLVGPPYAVGNASTWGWGVPATKQGTNWTLPAVTVMGLQATLSTATGFNTTISWSNAGNTGRRCSTARPGM